MELAKLKAENGCLDDDFENDLEDDEKSKWRRSSERITWSGRFDFILSIVGYTVGLGSVWRFPYLCYKNGGGAFFIPFMLFLVLCGGPVYYLELSLGQFSGKTAAKVWDICPLLRGTGVIMVIVSSVCCIYYMLPFAWITYYCFRSFYKNLGWASCNNPWNTPDCKDYSQTDAVNVSISLIVSTNATYNGTVESINRTLTTPGDEFWRLVVLGQSSGVEELGHLQIHLLVAHFVACTIIFLCLMKGIKSLGKVVYVTVPGPYILLTILFIRGITLDGGWDGVKLYLYPDFNRLLHGQIWLEAALQVFYSLGPAWGGVITMASFNKFHNNALRDTVIVCFADLFTAFYCGLVVFSMVGVLSKVTGTSIHDMPFAGPGLAFVAYPEALSRLPLPQLWSVLFFLTLIFVGIDSEFGMFETLINSIVDMDYHRFDPYRTRITMLVAGVIFLTGIPLVFSNGIYIFQLIDWYIATFNVTGACLLECIIVAWIYGANRFSGDIAMMIGIRPSLFLRIVWTVLLPVFLSVLIFMAIISYAPPVGQGGYTYPTLAIILGNAIGFLPLLVVPTMAVIEMRRHQGTILQKLKKAIRPSLNWFPHDRKQEEIYKLAPYIYQNGILGRLRGDILGLKRD